MKKRSIAAPALVLGAPPVAAREFPPGLVDPAPLFAAVAEEIGEAGLRCATFSGNGYAGAVGRKFDHAVNVDWPRMDALTNYPMFGRCRVDATINSRNRIQRINPVPWTDFLAALERLER